MTKMPLKRQADAMLPTRWGKFNMVAYARRSDDPLPHLAMVHESFDAQHQPILVRVHSECMTGDVFHSHRCDCGEQLDYALNMAAERRGVVIYLRQEGRGIGLINKLKAYQLQDKGFNTAEANLKLGFKADERTYEDAKTILEDLGIQKIILLTNNPLKINYLEKEGIEIVAREPIIIESREENEFYLHTKRDLMGHLF
jgi:GTP cyclohydrolase II